MDITSGSTKVDSRYVDKNQLSLYQGATETSNTQPKIGSDSSNSNLTYAPGTWGRILDILPR
jgi:hypothetical protein